MKIQLKLKSLSYLQPTKRKKKRKSNEQIKYRVKQFELSAKKKKKKQAGEELSFIKWGNIHLIPRWTSF